MKAGNLCTTDSMMSTDDHFTQALSRLRALYLRDLTSVLLFSSLLLGNQSSNLKPNDRLLQSGGFFDSSSKVVKSYWDRIGRPPRSLSM